MKKKTVFLKATPAVLSALLTAAILNPVGAAVVVSPENKLTASDAAAGDVFGRVSNSASVSGDTAVVGAYLDDDAGASSGSAYVFPGRWDKLE